MSTIFRFDRIDYGSKVIQGGYALADLTIECPKCQAEIALTETLARPLIDADRARVDREVLERTRD